MKAELAAATNLIAVNGLYWRDQLGNWEAYSLMNTLRVIDLARSCVWALARQDAVCASLVGTLSPRDSCSVRRYCPHGERDTQRADHRFEIECDP